MRADRISGLALTAFALFFGTGCAGGRSTVVADGAEYPLSLSPAVRDGGGKVVSGEELEHVGAFKADATAWGMLYSAIRLNPRTDISKAVNEQITRAGGEAIINLKIMGGQCGANFAAIVSAIPFWPGCTKIVIEGDIVKVKRAAVINPVVVESTSTPSRLDSADLEAQR